MQTIYRAEKLFTGEGRLYNQQIVVVDGIIQSVTPDTETPFVSNKTPCFIAPAFVSVIIIASAIIFAAVLIFTFAKHGYVIRYNFS